MSPSAYIWNICCWRLTLKASSVFMPAKRATFLLHGPYLPLKAFYRLALRPMMGPMRTAELTVKTQHHCIYLGLLQKVEPSPLHVTALTWAYSLQAQLSADFFRRTLGLILKNTLTLGAMTSKIHIAGVRRNLNDGATRRSKKF